MNHYHIQNILDQVLAINKRYEKISELSGENFNLFKILKLQSSEVRLHSAFLGEMLNPKGSHGQKEIFLELFIKRFQFKNNGFDASTAKLEIEKYIGLTNEAKTEGGRIDIILADTNFNKVIIENKIYARDQINQVSRYYKHSNKADLFYLTLHGGSPSKESCGDLEKDIHFKCLSYKKDILKWLEDCRKEVAVYPIIRETITQYINLIKHFTGQTTNDAMEKEISGLIKSNLEASFTIKNNINSAIDRLISENLKKQVEEIGAECNLEVCYYADIRKQWSGFRFSKKNWQSADITFQFNDHGEKMICGVCTKNDPKQKNISLELRQLVAQLFGAEQRPDYDWWLFQQQLPEPYNMNWNTSHQPWQALINGDFKNQIKLNLTELLQIIGNKKL